VNITDIFNFLKNKYKLLQSTELENVLIPSLRILLGGLILLAGAAKIIPLEWNCDVHPLEKFFQQMSAYHIPIKWQYQQIMAVPLIAFEIWLGLSLILHSNLRYALIGMQILMFVMIPVTLWGTFSGAPECGCYGSLIKREPWVATIEDFFVLLICFVLYPKYKAEKNKHTVWVEIGIGLFTGLVLFYGGYQLGWILKSYEAI